MKTGISGFPSSGSNEIGSQNFVTVEPVKSKHYGVATHPYQWVEQITASVSVVVGSTTSQIVATGHGAIKGDVVRFLTGALTGVEVLVASIIDVNNFTVAELLSVAPSNTDTFQLLRFRHPRIDQLGAIASSSLIQYTRNGANQTVTEDTVTPANNRPLPVKLENASGDVIGQMIMAGSLPVAIASDQSTIPIKAAVNVNGSGSVAAATVSTVITLTAPANVVGFILQCLDTSTANVRWSIGRVSSATLGQQLQPGRDTGFIPCGANVSLCAESGTQNYDIQWVSQ